MLVDDLLAYDLVPSELTALRPLMPEGLYPLQALAVRRGLLNGASDLLIAGPAGSGKSALVTLLAMHAGHLGQRVLVVKPEPGSELVRRLAVQPEPPELWTADLVIVDELESMRDGEDAALLSCLLRRIAFLKKRRSGGPRLVLFSMLIDGVARLATELEAELVVDPALAPPLVRRIGVLCGGRAAHCAVGPLDGAALMPCTQEELCLPPRSLALAGQRKLLVRTLAELGRRGASTLVLTPDEASCVRMASRLALELGGVGGPAPRALAELSATAPGRARSLLAKTLRFGVAIHGPFLSPCQQALIERGIQSGEVRLVCASQPPRFAAPSPPFGSVVVSSRWRWQRDPDSGRFRRVEFDRVDLLRLAKLCKEGAALLYARSPREAEELWLQLAASPRPLPDLTAADRLGREDGSAKVLGIHALWQRWADVNREDARATPPHALELLCLVSLGPFALPLPLLLSEQPTADYAVKLSERTASLKIASRPLFEWLASPASQRSHETLRAVKRGLLLHDWVESVSGPAIEDAYHVAIGAVGRIAADCAARIEALAQLCAIGGWPREACAKLRDLAGRLRARPVDEVADHSQQVTARTVSVLVGALRSRARGEAERFSAARSSKFRGG